MSDLVRLSLSMEAPLLERLGELVQRHGYPNRSEFVRDLIRQRLVDEEWGTGKEALGSITYVYDHHRPQLVDRVVDVQHDYHDIVLATTHLHLTHDLCMEVVLVRGPGVKIQNLFDQIRSQRGVLHAALSRSSAQL